MFDILANLGFIIIILALFGFIIKDAFNWEFNLKPPTMYKSYLSTIFHYTSIAIFVISIVIIFVILFLSAPNQDNLLSKFLYLIIDIIQKLEINGLLETGFTASLLNKLAIAFLPAFFYFGIITVTIILGRCFRFFNENWVKVEFKNNIIKRYPKIVSDDEQFFYFEQPDNPSYWEAIRKEDIIKFAIERHRSRITDKIVIFWNDLTGLWQNKRYFDLFLEILTNFGIYFTFLIIIFAVIFLKS